MRMYSLQSLMLAFLILGIVIVEKEQKEENNNSNSFCLYSVQSNNIIFN